MPDIFEIENQYTSGLYSKHPIAIVRGQGASLWDSNGREYIDCMAGHGVANLGHAHPEVAKAIAEQACVLVTLPETYYNERRAALMQRLVGLVPGMERVFFCNSGTEAIEAALKFSRLATGRSQVVAAMRGFHGRTMGALSATWNKAYREPFEPLVPGFSIYPKHRGPEGSKRRRRAVILEVVQAKAGPPADPAYLQAAGRSLEHGRC
jgi:acetylornithine/LysW-gamma-L-lysine aminotransferase